MISLRKRDEKEFQNKKIQIKLGVKLKLKRKTKIKK